MRVAIVHDYLTQRGGAERVVLAMADAFPGAPIHTSFYDPDGTFREFGDLDVRPMWPNRIAPLRARHRLALPLLAAAFARTTIDADVVLCSSSGWAHGVRSRGRKVVYCYNPARWLYQRDQYAPRAGLQSAVATGLGPALRRWDAHAAHTADRYVAISSVVRERIRSAYGIDAAVEPPPYGIDPGGPARPTPGSVPGHFLCVSRLMPYKNVAAIVDAFRDLPDERLVIAGTGPEEGDLRAAAPPNVALLGAVDDAELRWLYGTCRGLVAASYEDFGLTPVEAAAFGRPSAVLRWGGFLDTVDDGLTGVFFDRPEPASIRDALTRLRSMPWDQEAIRVRAAAYSPAGFARRLRALVLDDRPAAVGLPPDRTKAAPDR